jgi:hypothetical protein
MDRNFHAPIHFQYMKQIYFIAVSEGSNQTRLKYLCHTISISERDFKNDMNIPHHSKIDETIRIDFEKFLLMNVQLGLRRTVRLMLILAGTD